MPLYLVFYNTVKRRLSIAVLITTIARRSNRLLPALVEMKDLIESAVEELQNLQTDMSACRAMTFCDKKLYVVDMGLDCVFILNEEGTESEMFGSRGTRGREFRDPTGIVVDDVGTMMVVDSRNHRLQLIDSDLNFAGLVKV